MTPIPFLRHFNPRTPWRLPTALSVVVLSAALFAEHALGLEPCLLCLWQRQPWYLLLALGVVAEGLHRLHADADANHPPWLPPSATALAVTLLMGGAGLGLYHSLVEWGVVSPGVCTTPFTVQLENLEALKAELWERLPVDCRVPALSLGPISMSTLNLAVSFAAALWLTAAWRRSNKDGLTS